MKRTTLNMVRGNGLLYPKTDADYEVLFQLGIPQNNFASDFGPVLLTNLPSSIRSMIHQFDDLEEAMLGRFTSKWKYEVSITSKVVILTYPKNVKSAHLESAIASLRKWYATHFFVLELNEKRSGKDLKSVLTKKLSPKREV